MKPEEQRIAIAEACGLRIPMYDAHNYFKAGGPDMRVDTTRLPDYLHDLNAMNEAITQHGNGPQWMEFRSEFTRNLLEVVRRGPNFLDGTAAWYFASATPMQLAEAFLKTLSLWKNDN